MGCVHINGIFQVTELSAEERIEKSKDVTVNSITNNGKRNYIEVRKASKDKDVKQAERKYILTQNMQKQSDPL